MTNLKTMDFSFNLFIVISFTNLTLITDYRYTQKIWMLCLWQCRIEMENITWQQLPSIILFFNFHYFFFFKRLDFLYFYKISSFYKLILVKFLQLVIDSLSSTSHNAMNMTNGSSNIRQRFQLKFQHKMQ